MTNAISGQMEEQLLFLSIFGTMHTVFTPIVATAAIIAEEKEKNTLRVLIMANVRPIQYLISIGSFVLICSLLTGSSFIFIGQYGVEDAIKLLGCMAIGSILSIIVGMIIGAYAKNMTAANGIAVPVGMLFGFLPMLAAFNSTLERVSKFTFGQQISYLIQDPNKVSLEGILIIAGNFIVFLVLFIVVFRKNRLDV
jgi:ABC-2 type transport system permease protein